MDWTTLITVIACLFTILAVIVCLFAYLANKIDSLQKSVFEEMKDFHGRLCAIEERGKK